MSSSRTAEADDASASGAIVAASRVRHNRLWLAAGASPGLGAIALLVAGLVTGNAALFAPIAHCIILAAVFSGYLYRANKNPVLVRGEIRVTPEGALEHDGERVAEPGSIQRGYLARIGRDTEIVLHLSGKTIPRRFRVADPEAGRAVLRRLGLDAAHTSIELTALSRIVAATTRQALVGTALGIAAMGACAFAAAVAGAPRIAPLVVVPFALIVMFLSMKTSRVQVGTDGIVVRWLGRPRVIPFAKVRDVRSAVRASGSKRYAGVELDLEGGEVYWIPAGSTRYFGEQDAGILHERIREARAVFQAGGATLDTAVLARRGRNSRDWLQALLALGEGADADLRRAPVRAEQLLALVEDPRRAPVVRAAAAVALSGQAAPAERARIRIAADTTVSAPLKTVLDRAASTSISPDEEDAAEALATLEEAEAEAGEAGDKGGSQSDKRSATVR